MTNDTTELAPVTTEPAYGVASLERDAGYAPLETAPESEELTKDEAAERLKELSGPESAIITHTAGLPPNVTMTLDQAADALTDARAADKAQQEIDAEKAKKTEQKAIDKLRGDKPADATTPQDDGEIDVERALKSPKIAKAIAERVTAAETERSNYEEAVKATGEMRIAALIGDFPEMANLPLDQWAAAINAMHQREPARAAQIASRLHALAQVVAATQQIAADKTAREQTEFKAYAAKENARFADMTKNIPAKEMAAIETHVPKMLADHGADVAQFLKAVSNQSTFPRATAEALLVKAARYDLMVKNARQYRAIPPVPTIQRPGTPGPRVDAGQSNLASLSAKLSKSGSLKDAVALRLARSKGR